jgi:hypothetical protein
MFVARNMVKESCKAPNEQASSLLIRELLTSVMNNQNLPKSEESVQSQNIEQTRSNMATNISHDNDSICFSSASADSPVSSLQNRHKSKAIHTSRLVKVQEVFWCTAWINASECSHT